jgi:predicted Zn-dependent protease
VLSFASRWLTRRRIALLIVAVLAVGFAAPQAWAWYQLRAADKDLARFHPDEARRRLESTLRIWPRSVQARLMASRAARQSGDLDDADLQLREGQRIQNGSTDAIAFEWALLQAAAGNVREVESYLQREADMRPAQAFLVWEALAEGYLRTYRILDSMACLEHWLSGDQENVRALELRGRTFIVGKGVKRGSDDYRRVLELDPTRDDTRIRLTRALLDLGAYDEAVPHLEYLMKARPDDPESPVRLARCLFMLNERAKAHETLLAVLAKHPENGSALRTLGQFSLMDSQPAEAEGWLRRAAASLPNDYQTQWFLYDSLRQQGKPDAGQQLKVAEQVRERNERLGELQSRKLAEQPLDPGLHVEMAALLMRSGQKEVALRWLGTALALDPAFPPAHAALADYYRKEGRPDLAAEHQKQAGE